MTTFLNIVAVVAITFNSLASGAPAPSVVPSAVPRPAEVLTPVHNIPDLDSSLADLLNGLSARDDLPPRAAASTPSASSPSIILTPIKSSPLADDSSLLNVLSKRATHASLKPKTNVTLNYAASGDVLMVAQINVAMAHPSILLEDIDTVTAVDCSANSVDVTFGNQADFEESLSSWPTSDFLLFTNHLGDCDTDNKRGLYAVNSMKFNNATFTITASTIKSKFEKATTTKMQIGFAQVAANTTTAKRAVTQTFLGNFPGKLSLFPSSGPVSKGISVSVTEPHIGGHLNVRGKVKYNFLHPKKSKIYVEVDLSVESSAKVKVSTHAAYDDSVYTYSPGSATVSAFSIPGILDVGPMMTCGLGVEVSVSGAVDISSNITTSYDGFMHLDLMDSSKTVTSGWKPVYTHQTNISATVEAQVNPYLSVTAEIGVRFLEGLLDLSSGIKAKPQLVNVFTANGQFNIANDASVTLPAPTEKVCTNGMWYSSAFAFTVNAFVTQFYSLELYRVDIPIYKSGCWNWVSEIMSGISA
ncbi:hypothetical protein K504DRAFT_458697 [Pleomassaria siparia CBS 279.74]|uniref:Acid protease n=1 Tax=Pleomassaria siparia CBS 279.74 TaxID=1314801 RepID=A0A6G1K313_9PLEO|nr:hypothetical protein K504DRAFT_458697 [Pleomassaria siparia CBS 279.74]